MFEGKDAQKQADDFANTIHTLHDALFVGKEDSLWNQLYNFFDDYSINTSAEISNWNKIASEATSAADAMVRYAKQKVVVESAKVSFWDIPTEKLEEYVSLVNSGIINAKTIETYDELNTIMQKTGANAEDTVKAFKEFADDFTLSSQLISDMESVTELIAKSKDEIKQTGTIGTDSLSAIAKQFPELENAISQFNQGLISTDDLILLLQSAYESDADAFRVAMISKLSGNETFFDTIKNNNQGLFEGLAKAYGLDIGNWKSLAQAKAQIDQQLIRNLSSAWSKYYGTVVDAATGMTKLTGPAPRHGSSQGVTFSDPEQGKAYAAALDAITKANALKNKLDEAAKIEIDVPDFGGIKPDGYKGSGSKEKSGKDPTEFDWMEQKITLLNTQIDKLKDKIDVLVGYKGKNSTTNTAIDLMVEKMSILQQMHDKYIESANAIGLSQEYVEKIQNGTIEIESVSDENLAKQLKQYQELYKNAENCSSQIDEVTKSIHELNLSKLDNIITQFSQTLDIQNQILDTEKQILDLREKSGEAVYADDYNSLIERQLNLTRQNLQAYKELSSEMAKLNLQEGSEEWKKYNDQLQDYKNNMLSAADAVEQYKDAMTELVYKELNDFKSAMDSVNDTISTMNTLIGNTNLVDESGKLTDRGLAQVALYAQQLANSKQEAAEYAEAIQSLDEALDSGLITQDEYNSMLYEYTSAQNNAVKASKDAKDAILALVKEGIQAEIDAKKKLVDETKAALEAEQNLHDYQKSITEKQDNISRLQRAIASITSTDRESLAKKLQLQNELNKAMDELNETQYQHELEERKKALDDEYTSFEESKQKEMEELDSNLDSQEAAIKKYLEDIKNNYSSVYDILSKYGDEDSLQAIEDLTKPWESGSGAADLCSDAIGNAVSNINYEISNIDTSPLWDLVDALNSISEYGYGSNSKTNFEDISNTGKWQKGKDGKWWFGEDYREDGNYNYASGGIYSINGKQYRFDDDGYMQTEWQEHNGKQYYFDANDGHMVKSQWIPGKDGKQYYLLSDGTIAKDLAVKNENNYYYVDKDGVWDGSTLTEEEVKALGYKTGYKCGTPNATQGWHLIDESGIGTEVVITNQGILRQFEGGETVFDNERARMLWDMTGNPEKYFRDLNGMQVIEPDFSMIQPARREQKVEVTMNIGGVLDETTARVLNEQMPRMIEKNQKKISDVVYKDMKHTMLGK